MSDNPRPVAYTGDKPYIFVSYSQKDKERVYPFILALQERYNVWYDEGIPPGEEFEEEIARRIRDCAGFLFLASAQSLDSEYCKDELHRARKLKKKFIIILMNGELTLPEWFLFRYGRYQIWRLFEFSSDARAVAALTEKSKWLKDNEKKPVSKVGEPDLKLKTEVEKPEPVPNRMEKPLSSVKLVETELVEPPAAQPVLGMPQKPRELFSEKYMITTLGNFEKLKDGTYKLVEGSSVRTSVEIPNYVSVIGEKAFTGANLERIVIPDSVTKIESSAFFKCHSLRELTFSDRLTEIGGLAFAHCTSLRELTIPDSVMSIDESAFRCCIKLISVTFGRGLTSIPPYMFYLCTGLRFV